MTKVYSIQWNDQPVGKAYVRRDGLYYTIECVCSPEAAVGKRVQLLVNSQSLDLGILVPSEKHAGTHKRIPIKQTQEGDWCFQILKEKTNQADNFVPIRSQEPFAQLSSLENATLQYRNGIPGLCFTDRSAAPQGSDPNQICPNK